MSLVRLVYASHFQDSKFDPSELARILECAVKNNPELNVTGILAFGDDHFLQCLEGGREQVNDLYAKIARDPRHDKITLLSYGEISEREFGDWSMKMVLLTEKNTHLIQKFSIGTRFDPLRMKSDSAFQMLKSLRAA
jgi:hypothetical protein